MKNDELKDVLKIDFPEYKVDNDKIISFCKNNKTKNYKKRIILAYAIPSIILLIGIITLSIVLLNNRVPSNVVNINNSINSLEEISNDEEKIKEIMKIDKEIQTISETEQTYINNSKLSYETQNTVLNLKNSVEWKDVLDKNNEYLSISEIMDKTEISGITLSEGMDKEQLYTNNINFIDKLIELMNLPYISVSDKNSFSNNYQDILGDYSKKYYILCHLNDNNKFITINLYNSGYIVISKYQKLNEDKYYSIEYESVLISLIKLDIEQLNKYIDDSISSQALYKKEKIEYKTITKNNVTGIMIYYKNELYTSIYEINNINKFLDYFDNIELKEIQTILPSTSSLSVNYNIEYLEALKEIDNAYLIKVLYNDKEECYFISDNNYLYINESSKCFKSTKEIYDLKKILEEIKK